MNPIQPIHGSKEHATNSALMVAKVRPDKDWFIYRKSSLSDWTYTDTPLALPLGFEFIKVFEKKV